MLLYTIYLIAITAEAMSGALMGMRRNMDLFGICFIGTVTALGGGTARDMLLGHYPLGWVAHPQYLLFTIGAAALTALIASHLHHLRRLFLLVDALGLVAFTIIGCNIGMEAGVHPGIAIMAGVVTGVFGGLLRDVLCNQQPMVLSREFYASVSLATGALYILLHYLKVETGPASMIALVAGFSFRLLAMRLRWQLPVLRGEHIKGFD
ncbi:trimeric intracellular cation channel family protein [Iodobacter sp. HSC-16F04]|uniref:Trimeric intracellular cation channel family protein n=1 Tax=Iodobacter violaceini TaxID=3044271 RepID=A0ABX0KNL4_9NEIS|nr:trimeric intracellular cation channel family protein [Iodobacter violacea]NHQ86018.1 trimeric intracellular cation channel family protein [Iodobacter violacea]